MSEEKKGKKLKEPFDSLSPTHSCEVCGRGIKARLVRIKLRPPKLCYRCYKTARFKAQAEAAEKAKLARGRRR